MGLDNGFVLKSAKVSELPKYIRLVTTPVDNNIELIYLRKCWGLRREILDLLHVEELDDSITKIDAEDIIPITEIFMKYLDRKYYRQNADSIWEYDEYVGLLRDYIVNLIWLRGYMEEHPDAEVIFYDSY